MNYKFHELPQTCFCGLIIFKIFCQPPLLVAIFCEKKFLWMSKICKIFIAVGNFALYGNSALEEWLKAIEGGL